MADTLYIEASEYEEREAEFTEADSGKRLDAALAERFPDLSRTRIQAILEKGLVSPSCYTKNTRINPGDKVTITVNERKPLAAAPERINIDVVYEDDDLLVVDKARGMVVHPAKGNTSGTLVNALLGRYPAGEGRLSSDNGSILPGKDEQDDGLHADIRLSSVNGAVRPGKDEQDDGLHADIRLSSVNGAVRPGIVHRIDKNTSGLIVVAKSDAAHASLAEQFAAHTITRLYTAIVLGGFGVEEGTVIAPIGRDPKNRLRQAVVEGGKEAVTHWKVLERLNGRMGAYTLLRLELETGRTHQIRVHMASIGHPVLGDDLYGPSRGPAARQGQYLHAGVLGFTHPSSGERLAFESPLPEYFKDMLTKFRQNV
jgi:23S rRNA pseudouridine1911/1915/1917 synthase